MPKDDHIFKGLRAKKILALNNITNFRHPNTTTQEYYEIFGRNCQADNSVSRPPYTYQPGRDSCHNDNVSCPPDAYQPDHDACPNDGVIFTPNAYQSVCNSYPDDGVICPPNTYQPERDAYLDDGVICSPNTSQPEHDACPDDVVSCLPDTCQPECGACLENVSRPFNTSQLRQKIRALSLSDLTQDTIDNFQNLKKYQTAPHLGAFVARSESPSILIEFHRRPSTENDGPHHTIDSDDDEDETSSELEDAEYFGNMNEGRKRRHVAGPSSWKRNKAKRSRMLGEEYLGYSKPQGRKMQHIVICPSRQLGQSCDSEFCKKSKVRGCQKFTEESRQKIHRNFWKTLNWDQRKTYVLGLVTRSKTARKTKSAGDNSRRTGTLIYTLPINKNNSEKVQVCREMFLNTLSLGSYTVQSWVKQGDFGMTPTQEEVYKNKNTSRRPRAKIEGKILILETFLNCLPKLPSHYGRKDSNKLYIEPMYHSLSELYKAYKIYCTEQEEPQVCRFTFEKKFHEYNFSLYTLKKDMCDICSSYIAGNLDETDYQTHINLNYL